MTYIHCPYVNLSLLLSQQVNWVFFVNIFESPLNSAKSDHFIRLLREKGVGSCKIFREIDYIFVNSGNPDLLWNPSCIILGLIKNLLTYLWPTYSSTGIFGSPILVSDWLIICCRNMIINQKRNENDISINFVMKNN